MSAILNDRDVLLRASATRSIDDGDSRGLILSADAPVFHVNAQGAAFPSSITLTALPLGIPGQVIFDTVPQVALKGSGNSRTLAYADMVNYDVVTVNAHIAYGGKTYTRSSTIQKVRDGAVTYTWIKYATSAAGAMLSDSPDGMSYIGLAYNKSSPVESTDAADYSWSQIKGTDGVQGLKGSDGLTTYTWIKYADYADGTGLYDLPGSSTQYIGIAVNKTTSVESTNKADYVWSRFKGDQGVPGPQGPSGGDGDRGTVDIAVGGYSSWDDLAATVAVINAGYGYPQNRDRVTLYGANFSQTRFREGSSWLVMSAFINGNMLVSGTLSASQISTGSMVADRISGGTLRLANGNFQVVGSDNTIQIYNGNFTRCNASNGDAPGFPALTVNASGASPQANGPALQANGGYYGNAINITGGTNGIVQSGGGTNWLRTTVPNADNGYDCGSGDFRWRNIYVASPVITSSDQRTKTGIEETDLGLSFINALRPVKYRQAVAENVVEDHAPELVEVGPLQPTVTTVTPRPGKRDHYGLIAQEVRAALLAHGADNAALWILSDPQDEHSRQALRYEELIPPLIRAVQELSEHLQLQQQELNQLKGL